MTFPSPSQRKVLSYPTRSLWSMARVMSAAIKGKLRLHNQTCSLGLRVLALPPDMSIQVLPYLRAKSCKRNCRNLPPNFFTLSQSSFSMNSRPLSDALDWHGYCFGYSEMAAWSTLSNVA